MTSLFLSKSVFFIVLILFHFIFSVVDGAWDICNGDPEINRTTDEVCNQGNHLISALHMHHNPYHALHDLAWAAGHYIMNCIDDLAVNNTFIYLEMSRRNDADMRYCFSEQEDYHRTSQPTWGACLLYAMAKKRGIPEENIYYGGVSPYKTGPPIPVCFRWRTEFWNRFRELNYKMNTHAASAKQEKSRNITRKELPNLPFNIIRNTLRGLSSKARNFYKITDTKHDTRHDKIRVLIYGREDVKWRNWNNINETVKLLIHDPRIELRFVRVMPMALLNQVRMFRWADIVLSPHGAGHANTIFMKPGSSVIEVNKCCRDEVRLTPLELRKWTGWHSEHMDLYLRYVQCHQVNSTLSIEELAKDEHTKAKDRWCELREFDVDPKEAMESINLEIRRILTAPLRRLTKLTLFVTCSTLVTAFILLNVRRKRKKGSQVLT